MKYYIGIDNGLDGGITVVSEAGELIQCDPLPVEIHGKKRRVSIHGLTLYLSQLLGKIETYDTQEKSTVTFIYETPAGCKSAAAGISMQDSFARIETILTVGGYRRFPVTANDWQKTMWKKPKMAKGVKFDTKAAALKVARELWPNEKWLATERSKKPHDGMIDAALIAEFGRRSNL